MSVIFKFAPSAQLAKTAVRHGGTRPAWFTQSLPKSTVV